TCRMDWATKPQRGQPQREREREAKSDDHHHTTITIFILIFSSVYICESIERNRERGRDSRIFLLQLAMIAKTQTSDSLSISLSGLFSVPITPQPPRLLALQKQRG